MDILSTNERRPLKYKSEIGVRRNNIDRTTSKVKLESEAIVSLCLEAMASTVTKLDKIGVKFHVIIHTI